MSDDAGPAEARGGAPGGAGGDEGHVERLEPREPASLKDDLEARLLGSPRHMRRREVSQGAAVSLLAARRFWHALGFPNVRERDRVFTDADLGALRRVVGLVRAGELDESTALGLTRAMGRTTDRLAVWQSQLVEEALANRSGTGRSTPEEVAAYVADLADELEPLLVYAWRRHLSAALSRLLADSAPAEAGAGVVRAVGFADLVSFTALVRGLTEAELGRMVQQFEILTSDTVTARGGRVIKTLGDEVLFTTVDVGAAALIATELVDAVERDEILPRVRLGMACGPVVSRLGDVFGTTVNRASRLTSVARPGSVVVDERIAAALGTNPSFALRPLPARPLDGLGEVSSWALRRTGPLPAADVDNAVDRHGEDGNGEDGNETA
ncbi:MAG TPA: adenylate/guanylate cyclase domain-containing protein [Segeticoccus sp.]|uniref:adenylate/guanylate cyclase domain-containing protein n=1 Tax=Segeticoccus sp. TaxID=2706531 RepID=UPI002D80709A|nr:adenylate/guanylate cyclase domain-containing protein [Segeticoccus sp.]HET8599672.1 adenylate/guanylate cyclase domain-containing protein [Segeticoccus sp.]